MGSGGRYMYFVAFEVWESFDDQFMPLKTGLLIFWQQGRCAVSG